MSAIKRRRPPHRGQASTSNPKVRRVSVGIRLLTAPISDPWIAMFAVRDD
jgi:hypothetical protein